MENRSHKVARSKLLKEEGGVEHYLASFPASIQLLATQLRGMIKQSVPGVSERFYPGWGLIGYRVPTGSSSAYFGFLAAFDDRVVLGFEYGKLLTDPNAVLEGTGKQVRQVVIRKKREIREDVLVPLIVQAASAASEKKRIRR